MKWIEHEGRRGLVFDHLPEDLPIRHVYSAKQSDGSGNLSLSGGRPAEAALAERQSWSRFLKADAKRWVVGGQTHEANVAQVGEHECGRGAESPQTVLPQTDGLLTTQAGVPLYVAGADCATVLLACSQPRAALAVVHAGWRGAAAGIVGNAVRQMLKAVGGMPTQIFAGVAPCIGAASFEVGDEVAEQVPQQWRHQPGPKWHIDLAGWIGQQLLDEGIAQSHLQIAPNDTMAENDLFFSHRGDGPETGRQGLIAVIDDSANHG